MTTFIELHALRSFPPSNLNRDDLGSPKTAVFGGSRRLRISSQCLKRTWRTSEHFRGAFAEEQLGLRTEHMPEEVLKILGPSFDDTARQGLLALLTSIGKKEKKQTPDDATDGDASTPAEASTPADITTAHLLFLSRLEIETVAAFAREKADALAKLVKVKKGKSAIDAEQLKAVRKDFVDYLEAKTSRNAVDVGLFGRFVTSDEIDTVEGALQVAHGLGTQKIEIEYDYFTAVDDLGDAPGAGHLGETEFASSTFYLFACCDLDQLERNLGARGSNGRTADDESRALARKSLPPLVRAIAEATPRGKKTGTAPHTPAEYVEVVVRRNSPLSLANAFTKAVDGRGSDGDVTAESIKRLTSHRARVEEAYGRDNDVIARFVLCLRDVEGAAPAGTEVRSIAALENGLTAALAKLPKASA